MSGFHLGLGFGVGPLPDLIPYLLRVVSHPVSPNDQYRNIVLWESVKCYKV